MTHRRVSLLIVVVASVLAACNGARKASSAPPPTITFVTPVEGSSVHGSVALEVTATAVGRITEFRFLEPVSLGAVPATFAPTNSARLATTLDVSSNADGALTVRVEAVDEFGGRTSQDLHLTVSQAAPEITIGSPINGSTVKGAINIVAQAKAQGSATIASLGLVDAPPGVGADGLPSADAFLASWDSTVASEGPVSLHFRAVDSSGMSADLTIQVEVSNVSPGVIDAHVSAGAPIRGAQVDVYALDDATGELATSYGTQGLIGSAGPTDQGGRTSVTITDRNYSGPIRLVARSATAAPLTYLDPSVPANTVSVPSTLALSSIIPDYARGQSLSLPVTLYTTLADAEVFAYAGGKHRLHLNETTTLTKACAYADPLFTAHIRPSTPRWNLRRTVPATLTDGPAHSLSDADYAAFPDVALNMLARDLGVAGQVGSIVSAPYLLDQVLLPDLEADGQFDGLGESGAQLYSTGSPRQRITTNTMRVGLATALDEFMRSTRNLSGIGYADMNNAGIYTAISNDTTELFGTEAAQPFDNNAPSTTITVRYDGGKQPFGAQAFVRGLVTITVDATDASGVASTSVQVGGSPLQPVQGSSPTHYVVTYDSTAAGGGVGNGAVTFAVTSTDVLQNSSSKTVGVAVDNTPPTITTTAPSATAFYTGSVPFTASATDGAGAGVASIEVTGFEAIANTGAPPASFQAIWTVPTGAVDGALSGSYRACDATGNCASSPITVVLDRTPPTIEVVSSPGAYTTSTNVEVRVRAADAGSGVGAVRARFGAATFDGTRVAGTPGEYVVPFSELPQGAHVLTFWAVDRAQNALGASPNTGDGAGPPHSASLTLTKTNRSLTPSPDGGFFSYVDESGAAVASAGGIATVPVQYSFTSGAKAVIGPGATVNKLVTRTGWLGSPTAADLEGSNSFNIPIMRFTVPYDPANHAPITSASASVQVPGFPPVSFDLWRSSAPPAGTAAFLLPLSSNLIPALSQLASSKVLTLSVSLADMAGNTGTGSWTVTYNPLGPPVVVSLDGAYAGAGATDPRTVYYYASTSQNYAALWSPGTGSTDGAALRVLHYVVTNPAPLPVAVRAALEGANSWYLVESWAGANLGAAPALRYETSCGLTGTDPTPGCRVGRILSMSYWPTNTAGPAQCLTSGQNSIPPNTEVTSPNSHPLALRAYQPTGTLADTTVGGRLIVPAASGGTPGRVDVYVVRPVLTTRGTGALPPLSWSTSAGGFASTVWASYTGSTKREQCGERSFKDIATWEGTYWGRTLVSARETLSGTLSAYTVGLNNGAEVGVETSYYSSDFAGQYRH